MKTSLLLGAALIAVSLMPLAARAQDDITKHLINTPNAGAWKVYGPQTNKPIKDATLQAGGAAIEVKVPAASANPWDASAQADITGAITKGDQVIVAVWLKAKTDDASPGKVNIRVQLSQAPYTGIVQQPQDVGPEWKLYSAQTVAEDNYAKGTTSVAIHLAMAKQTIDLGPVFVLDMGPPQ